MLKRSAFRLNVDRFFLLIDAVAQGQGVALFPNWLANDYLKWHPGKISKYLPDWNSPELGVYLMYPHGKLPGRVTALINHVRSSALDEWKS